MDDDLDALELLDLGVAAGGQGALQRPDQRTVALTASSRIPCLAGIDMVYSSDLTQGALDANPPLVGLVIVISLAPASVPPASAAVACLASHYTSYSADYARNTDASGGCSVVGVRHKYNPPVSGNYYWTSWKYGGDVAQSPTNKELVTAEFTES